MTYPAAPPPPIDAERWYYRGAYLPWARALSRYHRMTLEGPPPPEGPCIYVALHGAGYLVLDLVLAGYHIAWKRWHERGGPRTPLRIVAAESRIEKALPGLPVLKRHFGLIDPSEESCLAVLRRGEQLLVTPGGMREARPARDFYRLRWDGRHGFVRLALEAGVPIVPLAVVGGAEAYPGFRVKRLSFWSPLPLPARLQAALGEPIPVPHAPGRGRERALVEPLHALARERTQALYDALLARRGASGR
ncbi:MULTISPECIES: lysophospholipid acyltransferase family protein [Anaeromyxobacter]|uniref:lysophospholipid acyltransferase family protein n=1 Tax=Anaeromyxobacter TaxID=161492 RepID=UPI001F5872E9|nr:MULTISPECIES: lysophospholipid acyltransferase family protein [unclassified Anaeromyxobacter]